MNINLILRWLIYLLFTGFSKGLLPVPKQLDRSKQHANFYNSSLLVRTGSDQLYSAWSLWSPCSVTCGVGISTRTRKCLKNSYNSRGVFVPLCHGEYEEHKICKSQICSKGVPTIREEQCSQYNNRVFAGKHVKNWIPADEVSSNPCELRCEAKAEQLKYSFGKVSNGTPCTEGACLDGRCLVIGCDDRLGSNVTVDMCGVCGGENSTCVHYKDVFQDQPSSDNAGRSNYHEVVSIPVESRHLIIRQSIGKNLLALQDRSKGIIFNGEQKMNKYGDHFEIAGSPVEYVKSADSTEELIVKGPLRQELFVLVLLRSYNSGIYYEYWVPKVTHSNSVVKYPFQSFEKTNFIPTKSATLPTTSQSYTVPVFNTKKFIHHGKHHPTKPAFAYGYGEKPYKGQEPPVFRHILSTSATTYKPSRSWYKNQAQYSSQFDQVGSETLKEDHVFRKDALSGYRPRYVKPETDYYQTFRNATRTSIPKPLDFAKEIPVQDDSGVPSGRHENIIANTVYDKKEDHFDFKPEKSAIKINKRVDNSPRKLIANGRLKYSFETEPSEAVHANRTEVYPPEQISINVLELPDGGKTKTSAKTSGRCEPCQRIRNQLKNFCSSDFVVRAKILNYEFIHGETRYELDVFQSYKNNFALMAKEYVWAADTCRCPKLRQGKEYVIMGKSDSTYKKRESRLLVDRNSFVRTFNLKYARRLQKLRKDEAKKCKKGS